MGTTDTRTWTLGHKNLVKLKYTDAGTQQKLAGTDIKIHTAIWKQATTNTHRDIDT